MLNISMQITKFAISSSLHCTANNMILNIVGIRVCQRFSRESEATLSDIGSETHTGRLAGEAGHHSAQPRHDSVRLCEGGGGRGPAGVRAGGLGSGLSVHVTVQRCLSSPGGRSCTALLEEL